MRKRGVCLYSCTVVAWGLSDNAEMGGPRDVSHVFRLLTVTTEDQTTSFGHRNRAQFTNPVTLSQRGMNVWYG